MKEETDLIKIKGYENLLLISETAKTPYSPAIVQHPFTNSGIVCLRNSSGQPGLFDLTKDQKALADWRKQLAVQINRAKSVMDIYTMLNKAYCLTFLKGVRQFLSSEDFSGLLSDAWIRSEYPNDDPDMSQQQLLSLFRDAEPTALMNTDEYAVWAALPDPVTVYRGVTSYNANHIRRMSWTLDRKTAEWFAHRFGENGTVYQARIPKDSVYAFFNGRNEAEIIVDPQCLTELTRVQSEENGYEPADRTEYEESDDMEMSMQ